MGQRYLEQRKRAGRDPYQKALSTSLQRAAHLIGHGEAVIPRERRLERKSQKLVVEVGNVTADGGSEEAVLRGDAGRPIVAVERAGHWALLIWSDPTIFSYRLQYVVL